MFKRPEVRLAVLGLALIGSSLVWYLISPLFTSREAYTFFPTLAVMASPTPRPATATVLPSEMPTAEPQAELVASGDFVAVAYSGSGSAEIYVLDSGARVLSFENFSVDPGPELHVLLSTAEAADAFTDQDLQDSVDLGLLLAAEGQQHYELPADLVLEDYDLVVIWCDPEQVPYAVAPLQPVDAGAEPAPET